MEKFDIDGFMEYLESQFYGFENSFLRETVKNLVNYGCKHFGGTKDSLVYFLDDILPELEFGEIARFADDELLTSYGKERKQDFVRCDKGDLE